MAAQDKDNKNKQQILHELLEYGKKNGKITMKELHRFENNYIVKDGVFYCKRSGVALETQFYPDCLHHPDWPQPIVKAGQVYHSETVYKFV